MKAGKFKDEIVPVTIKSRKGDVVVDTDEYPKQGVTLECDRQAAPGLRQGRHGDRGATPPASMTAPPPWC